MPHQVALTIRVDITGEQFAALDNTLTEICRKGTANDLIPFSDMDGVHFARLLLTPETLDLHGATIRPSIIYLAELDAPAETHVAELVTKARSGLDRLFAGCDGYPAHNAGAIVDWLNQHVLPTAAYYVNTVGRSLTQIRQEALLRESIEDFLDRERSRFDPMTALDVRVAIQKHVRERADLAFASSPPERPDLSWRIGETIHRIAAPAAALALLPVGLVAAPVWAALLRWHEVTDTPERVLPDPQKLGAIADLENFVAQNAFTAVGFVKPGRLRRLTINGALTALDYAVRHIYNRGSLSGVQTIHFARWIFLDDGRRVLFASNYDGSLESYMDEFIDKLAWGLNAVFSNGLGYPGTRWLVARGATDEEAFKNYLHNHQVRTQLWYSAYERLTAHNIETNARIRAGLTGEMTPADAQSWLALL